MSKNATCGAASPEDDAKLRQRVLGKHFLELFLSRPKSLGFDVLVKTGVATH